MPDITMCINKECPLRMKCYRFTAVPTPELMRARNHIHRILDPLWQGKRPGTRKRLYKRISEILGYEYHTANTLTINECRKVYGIIKDMYKQKEQQ